VSHTVRSTQQSLQPTLKAAQFWALIGCAGLGAAEAVVGLLVVAWHRLRASVGFRVFVKAQVVLQSAWCVELSPVVHRRTRRWSGKAPQAECSIAR
jgi:hypothetical protein